MTRPIYESAAEARDATDRFYREQGFAYDDALVRTLLETYLGSERVAGDVLDLCCGDGIWARGLKAMGPDARLHGIDISEGGIETARRHLPEDAERFVVGDAESGLPWPAGTFDLILARGPGLYNQHSMDRPAAIEVIERWHELLKPGRPLVSIFASDPARFGTYTNPLEVALPYNRAPRLTPSVDFTGGKYHHDVRSFLCPFRRARNVTLGEYRFVRNTHILHSRRAVSG